MNGFRAMGRVLASGTKQTATRLWWWQAARDLTGTQRAGSVVLRSAGTLLIAWFAGGTLWFLGWLPWVLPSVWFVCVGIFASTELGVEDTEPLPSPTESPYCEDEAAGQELAVEKGFIGKAPVVRIQDPNNPARTHLVWLDPKAGRS